MKGLVGLLSRREAAHAHVLQCRLHFGHRSFGPVGRQPRQSAPPQGPGQQCQQLRQLMLRMGGQVDHRLVHALHPRTQRRGTLRVIHGQHPVQHRIPHRLPNGRRRAIEFVLRPCGWATGQPPTTRGGHGHRPQAPVQPASSRQLNGVHGRHYRTAAPARVGMRL